MINYKTETRELFIDVNRMSIQNNGEGTREYKITVPIINANNDVLDWLTITTTTDEEYLQIDSSYTSDKAVFQAMLDLRGIVIDLTEMQENLVQ